MNDTAARARLLLNAFDSGCQIDPLSDADPDLTLDRGYAIAAQVHALRLARGERPVGRKIGFTNRTIWPIYGVGGPIWNWIYASGLTPLPDDGRPVLLPPLPELRLEPEIAFRIARTPDPGMNDATLAACIDGVAHGFELVFSVYPGWRFAAADTAAAFGMHAALWLGPWQAPEALLADAGAALSALSITLEGPQRSLTGHGADVLGGPLQALRFLLDEIARMPGTPPLAAGEVVTTGTLTDAVPIAPGEAWTTRFDTDALPGARIAFAAP